MHHEGDTFADRTVALDGHTFTNCTFERATLQYNGGPLQLSGCTFEECKVEMGDNVVRGIKFMRTMARAQRSQSVKRTAQALPTPDFG
jgi:hypothetical protein